MLFVHSGGLAYKLKWYMAAFLFNAKTRQQYTV